MNAAELKPCPFCGGPADLYTITIITPVMNRKVEKKSVGCFHCEAFVHDKFEDDAIGRWNTRVKE